MEDKENIQDNLKETAPNLYSINKENPFDVPENYFETLSDVLIEKCVQSEKQSTARVIHISFRKILIPLAVAASLILIVLISHRKNDSNPVNTVQYAYYTNNGTSEYLDYLIDNNELDESLIISELINDDTSKTGTSNSKAEENIKKINENPVIFSDTLNKMDITEDDIIQYLLDDDETDDIFN
jgi:hypothetical protein